MPEQNPYESPENGSVPKEWRRWVAMSHRAVLIWLVFGGVGFATVVIVVTLLAVALGF